MSDIGILLFDNTTSTQPIEKINNQFLSIKTFSDTESASIDTYLFDKNDKAVVFSPLGHIYLTTIDSRNNPIYPPVMVLQNPIINFDTKYYQTHYTNWKKLDYTMFSAFNSDITSPQFYVSLPTRLGNGAIGSGYILYRNSVYPNTGIYQLAYNPFHRATNPHEFPINEKPVLFSQYCDAIQFQDQGCYCSYSDDNRCIYAAAGSDTTGKLILDIKGKEDPAYLNALNGFKLNCGCNTICKTWLGRQNISRTNLSTCSVSTSNVFCAAGITSDVQSQIKASGININQMCGINNNNQPPAPDTPKSNNQQSVTDTPKSNHLMMITIAVLLFVVIIAIILIYFK